MSKRVFITGIGMISSIGNNIDETFNSLNNLESGISEIKHLETKYRGILPAGEIDVSNSELKKLYNIYIDCTRATLLALISSQEAISNAEISITSDKRYGLISANTVGGMDRSELLFVKPVDSRNYSAMVFHDCGASTEQVADFHSIHDYISTISTACSSSANAIMTAAMLIAHGHLDCAVAGGTDCLTRFTLNGFNSLKILDNIICNPFDENRNGLNLGEGAAYVVIESEEMVRASQKKVWCEIKGYGNSCDAFHQTATSKEGRGPFLAMQKALNSAALHAQDIDYINLHGTGTVNNDLSEATAIERLFADRVPKVSSTKSYTGHTLGAAGSIEAVISMLSMKYNTIFPSFNFTNIMTGAYIQPENTIIKDISLDHILSNSFGFGGNNTSLLFSKVNNESLY